MDLVVWIGPNQEPYSVELSMDKVGMVTSYLQSQK